MSAKVSVMVMPSLVHDHCGTDHFDTAFLTNLKSGQLWYMTGSVHNEDCHFGIKYFGRVTISYDYFGTLNRFNDRRQWI